VSPPGECIPVGDLYTYAEKYKLGNPGFRCPADVDPATAAQARRLAADAYRAAGCRVFARVDLFIDRRDARMLVNEINTIPGMTGVSVFPKVMHAAGLAYPDLLAELYSLGRAENRQDPAVGIDGILRAGGHVLDLVDAGVVEGREPDERDGLA
jgi:D-alanine-D-alanine ligase